MATYSVIFHQRLDNYAVIQTLENTDIALGESITISGIGHGLNGAHTVYALPQYLYTGTDTEGNIYFDANQPVPNQVMFYDEGEDLERSAAIPPGSLVYTQTCTWVTSAQVQLWLGLPSPLSADETTFLAQCVSAGNQVAYRRRQEAGYFDALATSPSGDVTLGTIMLAGAYYRQRGSIDQFASFDQMGQAITTNAFTPMVKQLLGIDRPAVA
jgi:hypothetical protein